MSLVPARVYSDVQSGGPGQGTLYFWGESTVVTAGPAAPAPAGCVDFK